jgi:hypothetical protein
MPVRRRGLTPNVSFEWDSGDVYRGSDYVHKVVEELLEVTRR